jgi:hypothetical protein
MNSPEIQAVDAVWNDSDFSHYYFVPECDPVIQAGDVAICGAVAKLTSKGRFYTPRDACPICLALVSA